MSHSFLNVCLTSTQCERAVFYVRYLKIEQRNPTLKFMLVLNWVNTLRMQFKVITLTCSIVA